MLIIQNQWNTEYLRVKFWKSWTGGTSLPAFWVLDKRDVLFIFITRSKPCTKSRYKVKKETFLKTSELLLPFFKLWEGENGCRTSHWSCMTVQCDLPLGTELSYCVWGWDGDCSTTAYCLLATVIETLQIKFIWLSC